MLSLAVVSYSHVFTRMNLDNNQCLLNMLNTTNENSNVVAVNTNQGNNAFGNHTSGNNIVGSQRLQIMRTPNIAAGGISSTDAITTKKIIFEMCGLRMDRHHWLNDDLCNYNESGLQLMTLRDFCQNTW